jgi:hypothetical protein
MIIEVIIEVKGIAKWLYDILGSPPWLLDATKYWD